MTQEELKEFLQFMHDLHHSNLHEVMMEVFSFGLLMFFGFITMVFLSKLRKRL